MRMLGLDVGDRRIGVAISDPDGRLAVPRSVVDRKNEDGVRAIAQLAADEAVDRVVVGLPVSLDGSLGPQALRTQEFAELLRTRTAVEVVLYDERLSSVEADRHFQRAGVRSRDAKQHRDAAAAAIVLQAYLDSLRFPPLPPVE